MTQDHIVWQGHLDPANRVTCSRLFLIGQLRLVAIQQSADYFLVDEYTHQRLEEEYFRLSFSAGVGKVVVFVKWVHPRDKTHIIRTVVQRSPYMCSYLHSC